MHHIPLSLRRAVGLLSASVASTAFMLFPEPPPDPVVHTTTLDVPDGALAGGSALELEVEGGPELIALTWPGSAEASFEVRALDRQGWTGWYELGGGPAEAPDEATAEWNPSASAGPAFLGRDITTIELRTAHGTDAPSGLVVHAIDSEPVALGDSATAAEAPPFIVSRAGWGADESWRDDSPGCTGTPTLISQLRLGVVHHTVSRNDYTPSESAAILRGIYDFHVHGNGWCDVAYNFFVDRFGTIFEGRFGGPTRAVLGGHTSGINSYSTGIAVIGDFQSAAVPAAAYDGLVRILAWKLGFHGVDPQGTSTVTIGSNTSSRWPEGTVVTLPNVEGHRDSNTTSCPGQYLYNLLPRLRVDVADRIRAIPPDQRLLCDLDGNGRDDLVWFSNGAWYVRNDSFDDPFAIDIGFGSPGDVAVCGDWDGNGTETPGVFRRGAWYLRNSATSGVADLSFGYGDPGDLPVVGDWTGTGTDRVGVVRNGTWYLRSVPGFAGLLTADRVFAYGNPGDQPLAGDWDGDGADGPGIRRADAYYLRNAATTGIADVTFGYGLPTDRAVVGDIDGPGGPDGVAVVRGSAWFMRYTPTRGIADVVIYF